MSNPVPGEQLVAQAFYQVMARHGVVALASEPGRMGSLAWHDGQVVHFGLMARWAHPKEHGALWGAVGLPGAPTRVSQNEEGLFNDLMRALHDAGIERAVWTADTRVAFVRDERARTGVTFKLENLNCTAVGAHMPGLHL